MKKQNLEKEDHRKFFVEKGDPGFSPKRNKAIIDNTIRKYEAMRKQKIKEYNEQVRERADAAVSYLKAVDRGKQMSPEDYFGKKILMELQAQKIVTALKMKYGEKTAVKLGEVTS